MDEGDLPDTENHHLFFSATLALGLSHLMDILRLVGEVAVSINVRAHSHSADPRRPGFKPRLSWVPVQRFYYRAILLYSALSLAGVGSHTQKFPRQEPALSIRSSKGLYVKMRALLVVDMGALLLI